MNDTRRLNRSFRLTPATAEWIAGEAASLGVSQAAIVEMAIRALLRTGDHEMRIASLEAWRHLVEEVPPWQR